MNINTEFIYYIGVLTIICYVSYCFLGIVNKIFEEEHICKIETPADVEGKEIIELIDSRPNGDIYITQVALRKLIKDMYILANRKS